jgi:hypothetical protein
MDVGGLFDTELDAAVRLARFGDYFPLMKNDLEPAMVMRDDLESSTVAAEGTTYIQQVGNLSWHEPEDCTQTGLCTPDACAMCTGTANCPASTHVRGCFADTLDIAGPVPSLLKATHRARAELAAVEANGSNQNCDNTSLVLRSSVLRMANLSDLGWLAIHSDGDVRSRHGARPRADRV